jgi:hypothetical protein
MGQTVFFRTVNTPSGQRAAFMMVEFAFWFLLFGSIYHFAGEYLYPVIYPAAKLMELGFSYIPFLDQIDFTGLARDFRNVSRHNGIKETMFDWAPWAIPVIFSLAILDNALTRKKHTQAQ